MDSSKQSRERRKQRRRSEESEEQLRSARAEVEKLRKEVEAASWNAVRRAELEEMRDKLDAEVASLREQLLRAQAEAEVLARSRPAEPAGGAQLDSGIAEQLTRAVSLLTVARAEAGLLGYVECDDSTRDSIEQINQSLAELGQILARWQKIVPPKPSSPQ